MALGMHPTIQVIMSAFGKALGRAVDAAAALALLYPNYSVKFTAEGGVAVKLTNKTGGVSVKGRVVRRGCPVRGRRHEGSRGSENRMGGPHGIGRPYYLCN